MRVQLEGRARGCHPRGEGSIPFTRSEGNHENTEKALDKWNVVHHDHSFAIEYVDGLPQPDQIHIEIESCVLPSVLMIGSTVQGVTGTFQA